MRTAIQQVMFRVNKKQTMQSFYICVRTVTELSADKRKPYHLQFRLKHQLKQGGITGLQNVTHTPTSRQAAFNLYKNKNKNTSLLDNSTVKVTIKKISGISNTRDSVSSGYPNTENTTRSGVFLTKFEVFG